MEYKHISESVDKFIGLVDGRRKGLVKSLRVGSPKVNNVLMNGFEWNRIVTVCGRSSSGKSLWVEQIKREFCDLNGSQSFDILSFEFEMLATDQIARNVSGKTGYSTKYIYSAEKNKVTEDEINTISYEANKLKTYPIYYVDETGTPDEIYYTVLNFVEEKGLRESKKGLVLTIDHVLLTKGKEGESEKHIIDTLCKKMIQLKKYFEANDMKIIIIMVSQLNRDIETGERVLNNKLHYPTRADIFGASSIFFASDYIFVIHKPVSVDGITGGYGPHNHPLMNPYNETQPCIYIHVLKERFGKPVILHMLDSFKESRVDDYFVEQEKQKYEK